MQVGYFCCRRGIFVLTCAVPLSWKAYVQKLELADLADPSFTKSVELGGSPESVGQPRILVGRKFTGQSRLSPYLTSVPIFHTAATRLKRSLSRRHSVPSSFKAGFKAKEWATLNEYQRGPG